MRFNQICVKVITFPSSLQHLYFAHLKHVSQPIKRSGIPSSLLPSSLVKWSNRGREREKESFICLHPSLGRELAYRVVVNSSALTGIPSWLKTNNRPYANTVANILSRTAKPKKYNRYFPSFYIRSSQGKVI